MSRPSRAVARPWTRAASLLASIGLVASSAGLNAAPVAADHTAAPTSVTIAGSLQSELGCPGDWQPECAATYLAHDPDDDVWQASFPVPQGEWAYKAALNASWTENYGAGAVSGGPDIPLSVGDPNATKFYYDHKSHWITSNRNTTIAVAPGSFQSELGCAFDWDPGCLRSWLQDPEGDGTYLLVTNALPAGAYEAKVALNESWDINYGAGGVQNGDNIAFTVVAGDTVTFSYDGTSHVLTITVESPPPRSTTVALVGSLQNELGCPGDWQPECAATELTEGADGVWRGDFAVPAGSWEYKVALNDTWDVNYGGGAQQNGPNIALTLAEAATVRFYFDGTTHWVTSSRNARIATAAGSFQSELGCAGDWEPPCLRTWLQDIDGDGTYVYATSALPTGSYEVKVAIDEGWAENYGAGGVPNGANIPFSVVDGDLVTISYTPANGNTIEVTIEASEGPEPGDEALALGSLRDDLTDEVFYFVMADRFDNGSVANDTGGFAGDRLAHGFDPTDRGFYHGGDIAGLSSQLDYLEGLGVTAIWMTPMFENRPVQGAGSNASAGYHGYWITDFTQIDPHFGTNAELAALVDDAHARGMKVFFDIITNHTADVIDYEGGEYAYRNKALFPYVDAAGNTFDDADYAGTVTFPPLNLESFPYRPIFRTEADATVKAPDWLDDPTLYHNRGDSTFAGESSNYGDFIGLDDLFTEHPAVVDGMIDIYQTWVTEVGIDGFRIDTVKHVNLEFWQAFGPELVDHAATQGIGDFFMFGEVFDGNPSFTSTYTTAGRLQAVLDFPFQGAARTFASSSGGTNALRDLFANDDYYTDTDSNAYSLPTFLGNHDMGRIGFFLRQDNPGATDAELLARSTLAHALMYTARGMPIVYYGDEQGFTGDGGDKDARQDMMPSQVASYNDDDLIGTDATTADANFDTAHPLYDVLNDLAALKADHPALQHGAQVHRYSSSSAGIYAFSRMIRDEGVEYVVLLNNAETAQTPAIQTYSPQGAGFTGIYPAGLAPLSTDASGRISVTVPPLGFAIYRADAALAAPSAAPNITFVDPAPDAVITGRAELEAALSRTVFAEVTFAVKVGDAAEWDVVGTDDNAPYRVFYDTSGLGAGTALRFKAVVRDLAGNIDAATRTAMVGQIEEPPPPGGGSTPDYAVVHYQRPAGDYDGWGLHFWGDIDQVVTWDNPVPLAGEDEYGPFAWVKLLPGATSVGFIVHSGDVKDTPDDRFFNPSVTPEIWLKQGDPTVYASQAAAQGYVELHYHRPDGVYDGWGLHLWGDAIDPSEATTWEAPKLPDEIDDYGARWRVAIVDPTKPVNFIVHRGDDKDTPEDRSFLPTEQASAWLQSGDSTVHRRRADAENVAIIHYHRDDGQYGDPTSPDFNDFWGMHVWTGAASPNPSWQEPVRPAGTDRFGVFFEVPLVPGAPGLNYIIHRGDEKDPPPDQFLDVTTFGHEVWYLSGHTDSADIAKYLVPILGGPQIDADLSRQRAQWLARNVIAWNVDPIPDGQYRLVYAPTGGLAVEGGALVGGIEIPLSRVGPGLSAALRAKYPHLAGYNAFRIPDGYLDQVPEALRGQLAVSASDAGGNLRAATGVQVPGALDDLYPYDGDLGVSWSGDVPTISVWAPTAKSVALVLYADGAPAATGETLAMTRDDTTGVWSITGTSAWKGRYYVFDVEVWAPVAGAVVHNLVTDPYSLALATNSTRSLIVDLADPALAPSGWASLTKPSFSSPEDMALYELHIRDFSINDATVPAGERGTYLAFTRTAANGMRHLRSLADAGLTHVHLLPAFDIATIEEDRSLHEEPPCDLEIFGPDSPEQQACIAQVAASDGFNWGYDPWHYTAPEGSYATNPEGWARTLQFRQMVAALNQSGLRVVMDVVYNHTNAAGQDEHSVLDRIVPGYYHRLLEDGTLATSTCCANTATEHAMMEKLMVDSVVTWARQYKVDGFRFDLMGHHSLDNMLAVRAGLDALTLAADGVDGSQIYVYGEGWNFGEVANNVRFEQATQLNMAGTGIGTFNDRLRDAVRGGGPFDADQRVRQGFASGLHYDPNGVAGTTPAEQRAALLDLQDQIKVGLTGNLRDYEFVDRFGNEVTGADIDYNGSPAGYTTDPQEAITYVSAHDNETLFDILAYKLPQDTTMADRRRSQIVALSTVALGQGVPFFHAGTDLLRSKSLDRNSYDSGDWFNRLFFDYSSNNFGVGLPRAADNQSAWPIQAPLLADPDLRAGQADITWTTDRFAELLEIRGSSPLFALGDAESIQERVSFPTAGPNQPAGLIVMELSDEVGTDLDPSLRSIVVLINASDTQQTVTLADAAGGRFRLHDVQEHSGDDVVRKAKFKQRTGTFTVPARTTAVFVELQQGS